MQKDPLPRTQPVPKCEALTLFTLLRRCKGSAVSREATFRRSYRRRDISARLVLKELLLDIVAVTNHIKLHNDDLGSVEFSHVRLSPEATLLRARVFLRSDIDRMWLGNTSHDQPIRIEEVYPGHFFPEA